jgi:hypothetical protein
LNEIINETGKLNADLIEITMLETLILCRPEFCYEPEEKLNMEKLIENTIYALIIYLMQQNQISNCSLEPQVKVLFRLGKLLIALRNLSLHFYQSFLNNLFKSIINDVLKNIT